MSAGSTGSRGFADRPVVAITGINGCVGAAVARAFSARDFGVRGLVRTPGRSAPVSAGWEEHVGDLTDPPSLRGLCEGVDTVVHTAAVVSDWDREEIFWKTNRDGTSALLDEAERCGVRRFVYVSTADVFGFRTDIEVDEESPKRCPAYPYSLSKLEGERLVQQRSERGIDVSIVYPTWVFGPGDRHLVPLLIEGLRARQLVYFDGGHTPLELTYSENLGEAIALVTLSDEGSGQDFIIGDEYGATFGQFIDLLAQHSGLKPPRISLPVPVALGIAAASETVARVARGDKRPMLTRYAVRSCATGVRFKLDKIRALGYRPRVGLEDGIQWTLNDLANREDGAKWAAPVRS